MVNVARSLLKPRCRLMSPSLACVVTEVSVSPSHWPVVNPPCECGANCRRMRPSVHPDHRLVAIAPPQDLPGEQLLRHRVRHHDELQRERTHDRVDRRVHLALALGRREGRDVVAQRLRAAVSAERHAEEIDRFPCGAVVVLPHTLPGAGEIDLGGRGSRREQQHDQDGQSTERDIIFFTIWTNRASDPICCRSLPS